MFKYIKENHKIGLFFYSLLLVMGALVEMDGGSVGDWIIGAFGVLILATPWLLWIRSRMKNPNIKHYQSKIKSPESGQENELSTAQEWGMSKGFEKNTVHKKTLEKLHAAQVDKSLSMLELAKVNQVLGRKLAHATDLTDIPKMLEHYVMFGGIVISYPIIYIVCMITASEIFMAEFFIGTVFILMPWAFIFFFITDRAFRAMEKKGNLRNRRKLELTVVKIKDYGEKVGGKWKPDYRESGGVEMKEFVVSEPVYKNKSIDYIKKTAFYSVPAGSLYCMLMVYLLL